MAKKMKRLVSLILVIAMMMGLSITVPALDLGGTSDGTWEWDESTLTLTLKGAELNEGVTLPDGATVVVDGDCSIDAVSGAAIACEGELTVTGDGTLTLTGAYGIDAASVSIEDIAVDFDATSCGIYAYNDAGDTVVTLTNVTGTIQGDYAGIHVQGGLTETEACVTVDGCDLEAISNATSYNGRARKSGITVYVTGIDNIDTTINVFDSKLKATGYDAGLSVNNYHNNNSGQNNACSAINIDNSIVMAYGISGVWSGIFASVSSESPDSDTTITIVDSSVYAVSPNTGILTSSQAGESRIILDNSILGASGQTALSMIEDTAQVTAASLKNGSTYVQMTPAAVMKGEIENFDGKTIVAVEGEITYNEENNYFVIPQNAVVTETHTDETETTYTFTKQAGGVGGFNYEKETVWGFDVSAHTVTYVDGSTILQQYEELLPGDNIPAFFGEPEKRGFAFTGWKLTSGTPDGSRIGTTDLVYTAQFELLPGEDETIIEDEEVPLAPIPSLFSDDHYAYIIGYPDGLVHPEGNITRAEVATIFFRLLDDDIRKAEMVSENQFTDVHKGQWYNNAVSTLASMGILLGKGDGSYFAPDDFITRAEFAAIAARFDPTGSSEGDYFDDIAGHWAEDEIIVAANNGWVKGENGKFRPDDYITRAEAVTLINRVLHRLPETKEDLLPNMVIWPDNMDEDAWYYLAMQEATNSHLYERKPNPDYETWTEFREPYDWSLLEY